MPRPLWHCIKAIQRTQRDVRRLRIGGITEEVAALQRLVNVQNELLAKLGVKIPKPMTKLMMMVGLSPGELTLWHDAEGGFFTETRSKAGAPPNYRYIDGGLAVTIIKEELTHEQFTALSTPDPYVGE